MSEQSNTERVMYNGQIYNRKFDAIWAAYFESLGIKAEYLPALPSMIPTFYLPEMKTNVVIADKSKDTDGSYTEDLHVQAMNASQPDHGSFGKPEADSAVMVLDFPWKENAAVPYCTRVNSGKETQTSIYDKLRGFFLVIDEVPAFIVEHCSKKDHFNGSFIAAHEAVLLIDEKERGAWEEAITHAKMSPLDFIQVFSESDPNNLSDTRKVAVMVDDEAPDFEKTAIEEVLEYHKEVIADEDYASSNDDSTESSERSVFGNGEENLQELSKINPAFEKPAPIIEAESEDHDSPVEISEGEDEEINLIQNNSEEIESNSEQAAEAADMEDKAEEKEPEPFVPTSDLENLFENEETEFELEPAENTFGNEETNQEDDSQNFLPALSEEEEALKNWIKMCLKPRKWINKNRSVSEINGFFKKMTGVVLSDEAIVEALKNAGYESKEDKNGKTWFKVKDHSLGFTAMIPRSYSPSISDWLEEETARKILKKF